MRALAAVDAQMLWLSKTMPNDQFLVFAFDAPVAEDAVTKAVADLRQRAELCPELTLRVVDTGRWRYPRWVPGEIEAGQFVVYDGARIWQECLDSVPTCAPLDTARMCWRVHVFPEVGGVPGVGAGSVVVVQISHALGDGARAAELAGVLLGRPGQPRVVRAPDRGVLLWRAVVAARAHRQLQRDVQNGVIAAPVAPRPVVSINAGPRRSAVVRTLVVDRHRLAGPTVTVGALVAIAEALGGYLNQRGEDIAGLAAEVTMAAEHSEKLKAHNNFRNVAVALHPHLDRVERSRRIADQLQDHRRRGQHPATQTAAAAFATVPAALLRWGMGRFDPAVRSATVTGHTVVSSVNRGPADLSFGGRSVTLTTGYPALSPMMGLTHGVHGIGDAVTLSVHTDPTVVDIDDYLGYLTQALDRQAGPG